MLGLRFCARAFSSCGKQGALFIVVHGSLTIVASLVAEHRLQMHRLSSCGSWAQLLRGMWDLPRPGLEPVSPASAGRFSTTVSPGKPPVLLFLCTSRCPDKITLVAMQFHSKCRNKRKSLYPNKLQQSSLRNELWKEEKCNKHPGDFFFSESNSYYLF